MLVVTFAMVLARLWRLGSGRADQASAGLAGTPESATGHVAAADATVGA
jgi:hypothetical protein